MGGSVMVALSDTGHAALTRRVGKAQRRGKAMGLLLVAPLLALLLVTFVFPIGLMLYRSVDNPVIPAALPETVAALRAWQPPGLPDEATYAGLASDLRQAQQAGKAGKLGGRLNYELPGASTAISQMVRKLNDPEVAVPPYRELFIATNQLWGEERIWARIKQLSGPLTASNYLTALDLDRDTAGAIVARPATQAVYVELFLRTLWVSAFVTAVCALLAYPIAYQIARQPPQLANVLLFLVLLPFWTSALVRTTAWIILLQRQGLINDVLVWLGVLEDTQRILMVYNMTGTLIAMVHVLLPFMVLPIYSVMKSISPDYVQAARSLGGSPMNAWRRVYFPLTLPGLGAGGLLVFISAIGYYITPALVGGRDGRLISNFIAYHMQESLNWGLAAALGTVLLAAVLLLYFIYDRLIGLNNLRLG